MTPLPESNISPRTSTWSTLPRRITTFQLLRMKSSSICCLAQFSQGFPEGYDSRAWGTCGSAMRTTWVGGGAWGWACRRAESGKRHVEREWKNYRWLSVPNKPRGRPCRALTSEFCPQRKHGPPDLREDCEVADR